LKGRSATVQMTLVMDDWTKRLDQEIAWMNSIWILDFMKAFDKVSHSHLIPKLQNFRIHPKILEWLCDFLHDRFQLVVYNNCNMIYSLNYTLLFAVVTFIDCHCSSRHSSKESPTH